MAARPWLPDMAYRRAMDADQTNDTTTLAALADLTLTLPYTAGLVGKTCRFRYVVPYTAAAITTGARWVLAGTATFSELAAVISQPLATGQPTFSYVDAFNLPAAASASSLLAGNVAIVEGVIRLTAAGTLRLDFASEVAGSAITAKRGAHVELIELFRD